MINSKNHIKRAILHFKRWSNRSYAIFNSIGRVVHIGFLSTLIRDLVTVKSVVCHGLLTIVTEITESVDNDEELLGKIEISDVSLIYTSPIFNTVSINREIEDSISESRNILKSKKFIRPFSGLFFIVYFLDFEKKITYLLPIYLLQILV